jgi:hypothetical protein
MWFENILKLNEKTGPHFVGIREMIMMMIKTY